MSRLYSINKIKQILNNVNQDQKEASQKILERCVQDHNFLLGLTEPFLRGIIGHALSQVNRQTESENSLEEEPKILHVEELSAATGLGIDIVKSMISKSGHRFGTQDRSRNSLGKRPKASKNHVDALKTFASQQKET